MSIKSLSTYSLVQASVRALYSTMLTAETWTALVQAHDLDAALSVLSKTVYAPYLDIKREMLTARRTAYRIKLHLAQVYDKVIRLTPEPGRQLLLWLWRLYEVNDLKAALRGVETQAPWDQVLFLLYPKSKHSALTLDAMQKMVQTGSVARAIELTRQTPYYTALSHALERYQAEGSLFPLEVALDLDHHRRLWQSIDLLGGQDREQALRIAGSLFDLDNLMWAIRYRVYHHLSAEEIINYTLPFGYQVSDEAIRAIAAGEDIGQIVSRIYPQLERPERIGEQNGAGLKALETALHRRVVGLCRDAFRGDPFNIGVPLAYLVLNDYEIRDLTVLIEAKSSELPLETFGPMLTLQPQAYRT
jgi:vacuolar-type H+-ATPase subunit C/Vma6